MDIGERLKEAREEQSLSLESLQEKTKIQKRYLEAIEQGNFKILPGTFYARAFIKEYASAVDLDPNELFEEYKEDLPQQEEENTAQYSHIQRSRRDNNPSNNTSVFSFIPTVIVVLLLVGIGFVIWFFYQGTMTEESSEPTETQDDNEVIRDTDNGDQNGEAEGDGNSSESGDNNDENTDSESEETEGAQPEFSVDEEGTGSPPESTLTLENASDDITVTIEANGDSWLDVESGDGEVLFSNSVTPEESPFELDLTETDRVWFNIGSAPAVEITIDGATLEFPVDPEEEVFQKIWVNLNKASEQSS